MTRTTTSTAWLFKKKQITGDGETLWTTEARCFFCRATNTYVPNTVLVANRPTSGVSITDTIGDCKQPWQFVYGCHSEQIETTKHQATIGLGAPRSTGARETQTDMKYAHPSKYRRGDQHKLLYWHSYPPASMEVITIEVCFNTVLYMAVSQQPLLWSRATSGIQNSRLLYQCSCVCLLRSVIGLNT